MRPLPRALFLPTACVLAVLAPPLAAQEREKGPEDDGTRAVRRVLQLRSGTTVRATSRWTGTTWEIKRSGKWQALPEGSVEGAALERVLEAEYRRRAREAGRDDADARAEVARWTFENGLLEEGLAQAEGVLHDAPDHRAVLELLAAHAHRFSLPRFDPRTEEAAAATDELLKWAALRARAPRELAVHGIGQLVDRETVRGRLGENLFATTSGRRTTAALALGRLFPAQELEPLIHRAVLDPSEDVRTAAARSLALSGVEETVVPVSRALGSSHPKVRLNAIHALERMAYPAAVPALVARLATLQGSGHRVPHSYIFTGRQFAYIQDFDVEVAQFSAVADPSVNVLVEGNVLDAGVHSVEQALFATEGRALRSALAGLTGADVPNSNRAWMRWWDENGATWSPSGE